MMSIVLHLLTLLLFTHHTNSAPPPPPPPPLNIIHVDFNSTLSGHFHFGFVIGTAQRTNIQHIFQTDKELATLVTYSTQNATGKQLFSNLVAAAQREFPQYFQEILGTAAGAQVSNVTLLVNQFREELVQTAPELSVRQRKQGRGLCSSAFVHTSSVLLLGHNDDWTQNWRGDAYWVFGKMKQMNTDTTSNSNVTTTLQFATWVYPGYLPGMDLSWNSHGMLYSVNSLFPVQLPDPHGVGTAFVARHLLESTSMTDAIRRASNPRVSTAMSYNLGSLNEHRLVELEVTIHGGQGQREITMGMSYFHGNLFIETKGIIQRNDPSTSSREKRWKAMQPVLVKKNVRNFLGDTKGVWPVYRNHIEPDDCYTDVTGIFDLNERTMQVWSGNPKETEPMGEWKLDF